MAKHEITVRMEYQATIEIEAEDVEDAEKEALDMAGDGKLLRDAELVDAYIEV